MKGRYMGGILFLMVGVFFFGAAFHLSDKLIITKGEVIYKVTTLWGQHVDEYTSIPLEHVENVKIVRATRMKGLPGGGHTAVTIYYPKVIADDRVLELKRFDFSDQQEATLLASAILHSDRGNAITTRTRYRNKVLAYGGFVSWFLSILAITGLMEILMDRVQKKTKK